MPSYEPKQPYTQPLGIGVLAEAIGKVRAELTHALEESGYVVTTEVLFLSRRLDWLINRHMKQG